MHSCCVIYVLFMTVENILTFLLVTVSFYLYTAWIFSAGIIFLVKELVECCINTFLSCSDFFCITMLFGRRLQFMLYSCELVFKPSRIHRYICICYWIDNYYRNVVKVSDFAPTIHDILIFYRFYNLYDLLLNDGENSMNGDDVEWLCRVYIEEEGQYLKKLYVTSIRESDAGLYECRSRIANAWQRKSFHLNVFGNKLCLSCMKLN